MARWASSHDVFRLGLCERRRRPEVLRAARVSYRDRDDDFRDDLPKANEVICQEGYVTDEVTVSVDDDLEANGPMPFRPRAPKA